MAIRLENNNKKIEIALRNVGIDEIDSIIDRLQTFRDKLNKKRIETQKQEEEVQQLLEKSKELEEKANIRICVKRTSFTRPPKYQFIDEHGEYQTWAGVGKLPKALKEKITQNGEVNKSLLEKYLIDKSGKAQYQFREPDGQVKTWSGTGKKPDGLQLLLDKGYKLEQFKIKEH